MSFGHGFKGPLRSVVEVVRDWHPQRYGRRRAHLSRKVVLECGHVVGQCRWWYQIRPGMRVHCHICEMEGRT